MKEVVILLVENEEDDIFFFRRALAALKYDGVLHVVDSVPQARDYLDGNGAFSDRSYYPVPNLIVSDYQLNAETGVELFHWLRTQPAAVIPFVLFTNAASTAVGIAIVQAGASAYVTKSANFIEMKKSMEDILRFLPPPDSSTTRAPKSKRPPR